MSQPRRYHPATKYFRSDQTGMRVNHAFSTQEIGLSKRRSTVITELFLLPLERNVKSVVEVVRYKGARTDVLARLANLRFRSRGLFETTHLHRDHAASTDKHTFRTASGE